MAEFIKDGSPEEIADIIEVLYALIKDRGFSKEQIELLRKKKLEERGGFESKIILDYTTE